MAKHAGAYKSEKRRKELSRLKKQEEKRQRRFSREVSAEKGAELIDTEDKEKEQEN